MNKYITGCLNESVSQGTKRQQLPYFKEVSRPYVEFTKEVVKGSITSSVHAGQKLDWGEIFQPRISWYELCCTAHPLPGRGVGSGGNHNYCSSVLGFLYFWAPEIYTPSAHLGVRDDGIICFGQQISWQSTAPHPPLPLLQQLQKHFFLLFNSTEALQLINMYAKCLKEKILTISE